MAKKLYILPFDHRDSFIEMFGFSAETLSEKESDILKEYKQIIYEGFLAALEKGVSKENAAILVDERFGSKIQEEARKSGIVRLLPVEKSGKKEFGLEYEGKFKEHIEKFEPDYVKVLVRYSNLSQEETDKLKTVNDFCKEKQYKFLFELLVSLSEENGQAEKMKSAIKELQASGIEPDIWKLEGLEDKESIENIVGQVKEGGRDDVGIVILGRGEGEEKVEKWLAAAAAVPGVVGFAVGRTVFRQPLLDFHQKKISREEAVEVIARNYKKYVNLFENN